jgi:hypothetical protein
MYLSKNALRADNQQERLDPWWIVGFVDGEGCFSISTFKNKTCKSGYQTFPEFVITQGEKSKSTMEAIKSYFGCGNIYINRRYDNHKYNLLRYCVRRREDLKNKIIPFFQKYPLQSAKREQFEDFCKRLNDLESSTTIRATPPSLKIEGLAGKI